MSAVETLAKIYHELVSYYPVIIPCLLVFSRNSEASLRLWNAASAYHQCRSRHEDGHEGRKAQVNQGENKDIKKLLLRAMLALVIVTLLFTADFVMKATYRKIFYECTLFVPFVVIVSMCAPTEMPLQHPRVQVSFGSDGEFGIEMRGSTCLSDFVLSVLIVAGALVFEFSAPVFIVYISVLDMLIGISLIHIRSTNFKIYFWLATGMGVLLLLALVNRQVLQGRAVTDGDSIKWGCYVLSAVFLLVPFSILCMLLRFDHAKATPTTFHLHVNETLYTFAENELEGHAPPRSHYTLAACIFGCSFVVLSALSTSGVLLFRVEELGLLVTLLATPSMIYSALILAVIKGHLKDLWESKEVMMPQLEWAGIGVSTQAPLI